LAGKTEAWRQRWFIGSDGGRASHFLPAMSTKPAASQRCGTGRAGAVLGEPPMRIGRAYNAVAAIRKSSDPMPKK